MKTSTQATVTEAATTVLALPEVNYVKSELSTVAVDLLPKAKGNKIKAYLEEVFRAVKDGVTIRKVVLENVHQVSTSVASTKTGVSTDRYIEMVEGLEGQALQKETTIMTDLGEMKVENFLNGLLEVKFDKSSLDALETGLYVVFADNGSVELYTRSRNTYRSLLNNTSLTIEEFNKLGALRLYGFQYTPGMAKVKRLLMIALPDTEEGKAKFREITNAATNGMNQYFVDQFKDREASKADLINIATRESQTHTAGVDLAKFNGDDVSPMIDLTKRYGVLKDGGEIVSAEYVAKSINNASISIGGSAMFKPQHFVGELMQARFDGVNKVASVLFMPRTIAAYIHALVFQGYKIKYITREEWMEARATDANEKKAFNGIKSYFKGYDAVIIQKVVDKTAIPTYIATLDEMKVPVSYGEGTKTTMPVMTFSHPAKQTTNHSGQMGQSLLTEDAVQNMKDMRVADLAKQFVAEGMDKKEALTKAVENQDQAPLLIETLGAETARRALSAAIGTETDEEGNQALRDPKVSASQLTGDSLYYTGIMRSAAPRFAFEKESSIVNSILGDVINVTNRDLDSKSRDVVAGTYASGLYDLPALLFNTPDDIANFKFIDFNTDEEGLTQHEAAHLKALKDYNDLVEAGIESQTAKYESVEGIKPSYMQIRKGVMKKRVVRQAFEDLRNAEAAYRLGVLGTDEVYSPAAESYARKHDLVDAEGNITMQLVFYRSPKPGARDFHIANVVSRDEILSRIEDKAAALLGRKNKDGKTLPVAVVKELMKGAKTYMKALSDGIVMLPFHPTLNLIMSGSDWDMDGFTLVFDQRIVEALSATQAEAHSTTDLL